VTANLPPHPEQQSRPAWVASVIERQLRDEFPTFEWMSLIPPSSEGLRSKQEQVRAKRDARHAVLMALPLAELETLRRRHAARDEQTARERQEKEATKAAKKEAAKFYNQPQAVVDFAHWGKMEYWTFDEALALLLGKNPKVLTRSAMQRELTSGLEILVPGHVPKRSAFGSAYENLRQLAERATVMQGTRLLPAKVLHWAHHSAGIELPAALLKAVVEHAKRTQPSAKHASAAPVKSSTAPVATPSASGAQAEEDAPVLLKRAALVEKYHRTWPTVESDLNHSNENGLSTRAKAAKHGYWREADALQWARENGKLPDQVSTSKHGSHDPFGIVHRLQG
jgi:hypothetical protein